MYAETSLGPNGLSASKLPRILLQDVKNAPSAVKLQPVANRKLSQTPKSTAKLKSLSPTRSTAPALDPKSIDDRLFPGVGKDGGSSTSFTKEENVSMSSNQQQGVGTNDEPASRLPGPVIDGLIELLSEHTEEQLNMLCKPLRIDTTLARDEKISLIFKDHAQTESDVERVLSFMWEDTVLIFNRKKSINVNAKKDPREILMGYWRKQKAVPLMDFASLYVNRTTVHTDVKAEELTQGSKPVTDGKSSELGQEESGVTEEDLARLLDVLQEREHAAKEQEKVIRRERDFRAAVSFFHMVHEMREAEKAVRLALLKERDQTKRLLAHCLANRNKDSDKGTNERLSTTLSVNNIEGGMPSSNASDKQNSEVAGLKAELQMYQTKNERAEKAIRAARDIISREKEKQQYNMKLFQFASELEEALSTDQ